MNIQLKRFTEIANENGYEVFTSEELATKVKSTILKSKSGKISREEVDEFADIVKSMGKVTCVNEKGEKVTRYYSKLNDSIVKARAGRYQDTPENRRLHRVGQPYGVTAGGVDEQSKKGTKKVEGSARLAKYSNEKLKSAKEKYSKRLEEAKKKGDSDLEKKLNRRIGRIDKELKVRTPATPKPENKKTGGSARLSKYSSEKLESARGKSSSRLEEAKKKGDSELEKKKIKS